MPKEYVYDEDLGKTYRDVVEDGPGSAHTEEVEIETNQVSLGWSKEQGSVQIATLADEGRVLNDLPEGNGWFVSLDRAGCNRLIRLLRKARDDAFGRDE